MPNNVADIRRYLDRVERASLRQVRGKVKEVVGLVVKAALPEAWIGELCLIKSPRSPTGQSRGGGISRRRRIC